MQRPNVWTVTQVVAHLKHLVENDPSLRHVWVVGELANVKHHSSGHWYFSLKDEAVVIRAVMFRREASGLEFQPDDGQAVLALGRIGVFERDGQTQLYVQHLEPVGTGRQHLALEALKRRLAQEGLFDRPKRALPLLPRGVGVVTSRTGAALQDIRSVVQRRFPGLLLVVAPVLVQGEASADAIVGGLQALAAHPLVDVVIVARGGGAREDLAAFNDERVVRAMYRCPVPVVSAIGHEIDMTLADLVADVRAPTPSAAAEITVPERTALLERVVSLRQRASRHVAARLQQERRRLAGWCAHGVLASPANLLTSRRLSLARLADALEATFRGQLAIRRQQTLRLAGHLEGLNPVKVLGRGFSLVTDVLGHPVRAREITPGQPLIATWSDGVWEVQSQRALPAKGAEDVTADTRAL